MKTALLFPGQGAQFIGMGQQIIEHYVSAQNIFNQLPQNLQQLIIEGPIEILSDTRYTQPTIFTISMAILSVLHQKNIKIDGVAGLSLGEYSALCAADAFSFEQGLQLVTQRAQLMHDAVPEILTSMLAIIGQSEQQLVKYIVDFKKEYISSKIMIANYNTDEQQVVAGTVEAINHFKNYLKQQRVKSIILKVNGPFHTSLLASASQQFLPYLQQVNFQSLKYDVYSNVNAQRYYNDSQFAHQLAQQISSPVYFYQMIQQMIKDGYCRFIEIGPGTILSKFVKKIAPDVEILTINNLKDLEQI